MNSFTKSICIVAFLMGFGANAFAQNKNNPCPPANCPCPPRFEQGMELCNTYPAAYNAPARIDLDGCWWDLDVYASFIYWHVSQESMDLPVLSLTTTGAPVGVVFQPFDYKPGFKVGIGSELGHDNWTWFAEYTRLHQTTTFSSTLAPGFLWAQNSWFAPEADEETYAPTNLTSSWKMNFDMVDLDFSRPYYQGTYLTISPYGGLRGLWITEAVSIATNPGEASVSSTNIRSHCWSVGPLAGVCSHWLMGSGFRFEGKASGSLLFTRYTKLAVDEFFSAIATADVAVSANPITQNYDVLRPAMELGIGIGWGTYLNCGKWYIDLSASYDFLHFWGQNMPRYYATVVQGASITADSLQMHGLTTTARVDF